MARQKAKVLPARKAASRENDSLLMRSAESLGRVIGSLQRQVQNSAVRLSSLAEDAANVLPPGDAPKAKKTRTTRKASAPKTSARKTSSPKTSSRGTSARKTSARAAAARKR